LRIFRIEAGASILDAPAPEPFMATLTLKNFPAKLYVELKALALRNRRSLNQEAIRCLEQAVEAAPAPAVVARRLAALKAGRARVTGLILTDEAIDSAKRAGRR
jgi:plasmid stability protein